MRKTWLRGVAYFALATTLGCRAPSPDWNGIWKLNASKSNFQGPVFTITVSADGEYRYDDGNSSFTFRCDGKDRPIEKTRTRACVESSASALDLIGKENGVKARANHWELSTDGRVFTSTATAFRPTGSVITNQVISLRMSGSKDFAGRWQDMSYLQQHADMTLKLDSKTLYIGYPNAGQYIDAPLNGADAAMHGPHAPEGLTYKAHLVGKREILIQTNRNGRALTEGSLELSSSGKGVVDSWWTPGKSTNKGALVYEKQ